MVQPSLTTPGLRLPRPECKGEAKQAESSIDIGSRCFGDCSEIVPLIQQLLDAPESKAVFASAQAPPAETECTAGREAACADEKDAQENKTPSLIQPDPVQCDETTTSPLFDVLAYDKTRLQLGVDDYVRPGWKKLRDTLVAALLEPTDDPSSVVVLTGPMARSKAKYIARACRRAFVSTTPDCRREITRAFGAVQLMHVWLRLTFSLGYACMSFLVGQILDQLPWEALEVSVFVAYIAFQSVFTVGVYVAAAAKVAFLRWHVRTLGDDAQNLVSRRWRWLYVLFDLNERPNQRQVRANTLVLAVLLIPPIVVLSIVLGTSGSSGSHGSSNSHTEFGVGVAASVAVGAINLALECQIVERIVNDHDHFPEYFLLLFPVQIFTLVSIIASWLIAYGYIPLFSIYMMFSLTILLFFVLAGTVCKNSDLPWMQLINRWMVRREALPWFCVFTLAWIKTVSPTDSATARMTWTETLLPLTIAGCLHVIRTIYWACVSRFQLGMPNMITFAHMTDVERVWSRAKLSDDDKVLLNGLRGSREFNECIAKMRTAVRQLNDGRHAYNVRTCIYV